MKKAETDFIDCILSAPDCPPQLFPLRRLREEHITALSALRYARKVSHATGDRSVKYETVKAADRCRARWRRARAKIIVQNLAK